MSNFKWKIFSNFVAVSDYPNFTTISFTSMETNFIKRVGIIISHRLENPGFVSKLRIRALSDFTMWMMKSLAI